MTESNISFLYDTDHNSKTTFDCFYAHIIDDLNRPDGNFLRTNYLTPYCIRLSSNDSINKNLTQGYVENTITFKSLRSQGITSKQLFQWSISIDIIEQYAIYLINNNPNLAELIFYNCSLSWFGSHCQYTFGSNIIIESFGDFIISSFNNRKQYQNQLTINTCYPYLSGCYRGPKPMCLDWREICNGIIDCIGDNFGIDEEYCDELEMTECKEDEYRCHNGAQCIPFEFLQDGWTSKDCLDGTDEDEIIRISTLNNDFRTLDCIKMLTFPCEELSCRAARLFPCGDGECMHSGPGKNNFVGVLCSGTKRDIFYLRIIHKTLNHLTSDCQELLLRKYGLYTPPANDEHNSFENWFLSNNCSMKYLPFPADPIFNGYFQVIYSSENLPSNAPPLYVCNDPRQCLHLPKTAFRIGRLDCRPFEIFTEESSISDLFYLHSALASDADLCPLMGNTDKDITNSSLFYCESSHKYISKYRLVDGINDCYGKEDEDYPDSCSLNQSHRFPCTSEKKCLSPIGIGEAAPNCIDNEDILDLGPRSSPFGLLCNNIPEYSGENGESDESNCEWWPCNNPYTRCDDIYHCANCIDELGCSNSKCGLDKLKCTADDAIDYQCISQAYIYEKPIDCIKDDDDKLICRRLFYSTNFTNGKNEYLSWKEKTCLTTNDICGQSINNQHLICTRTAIRESYPCTRLLLNMDDNEPLCTLKNSRSVQRWNRFLSTMNFGYLPLILNLTLLFSQQDMNIKTRKIVSMNTNIELIEYCNRGILIFEGESYEKKCLCPPSYFGDQCQWQSQRISLTLQIRKMGSLEKKDSIYDIFIYLIDNEFEIIHYYEQTNYISSIDCGTKFNRYLLYSTSPKNQNYSYSLRIDIYDKITLNYYGSWHLFIPFQFLPVNRISIQLIIPLEKSEISKKCLLNCGIHGKCFAYINSTKTFCKCNQGYSGRFCDTKHECLCSAGSICLNSSICLCSLNKFGSKCYLQYTSCQHHNPCENNGQCIPSDHRIGNTDFICLCNEAYMGSYCEYKSNQIDIHFKTDVIPSVIFAHFIRGFDDRRQERITKFKKVPFDQYSVTLFIRHSFHILFIEYLNNSYLAVLREESIPSEHISIDISIDNMCINITKLLNSTMLNYSYLRRLKYYQLPCIENAKLKCFYDEKHMCICDKNRYSNCFEFNHNMTYNCRGYNYCQNNGTCFQDNATCPTTSMCMCEKCYYGNKCQFNTKGVSLSLDALFGYHIKPSVPFLNQSKAVKITAGLTIVMFILGYISGSLSIFVFRRKSSIVVGCGIYLLTTSIISLLTISIFTIKYWQLIIFQMNVITNRSFLYVNCLLTDVLLKILLSSGDWLNASVAIERAFTAVQGVKFNKLRSKYIAKYVISIIFLLTTISYIHDPISRELFDDENEERIWCIVNYPSKLKIFDTFVNLVHFLTPFIINLVSALIITIQVFKTRAKTQRKQIKNKTLFYAEIKRHKHLLIAPCILIILAFPRLIISFLSRCMESVRDPWLFLIGYYISFIPSLLIFVVFVLSSDKYMDEFRSLTRKNHLRSR